ncbi:hypothetical protein V2J09_022812 [Rumex salicifolius]
MPGTLLFILLLATSPRSPVIASDEPFDVHLHLSTVSRYDAVKDIARHGTRSPTEKRMRELDRLGDSLRALVENADKNKCSETIPAWFYDWRSPWEGKPKGGELLIQGEEEHYTIALRVRERFAELFSDEYHPDVPRASASAVAFGMGLFKNKGAFGEEGYRAFGMGLLSFLESQEPAVEKMKEPFFDEIANSLSSRYGLNFTRQHVSSLWLLCQQVELLEWTDDIELFVLKGLGNSVNYDMGVPLLNDVFESMESAIKANEEAQPSGSFEKARLWFAHAETLVPFSCLLGLFLEDPDFAKAQRKEPLQLPPKPPQRRTWKGSTVAPFAGNLMLVLHSCPDNASSNYFVQALHNEHPLPILVKDQFRIALP